MKRNPESPWNPANSVEVTPQEYETQVYQWLKSSEFKTTTLEISQLKNLSGSGGEYEIDCFAQVEIFQGALIKIIIECKRYSRPVEREKVLALHSKMLDTGAHKAMMFSTSGFQSGAIEYSASKGIALITFVGGDWLYEKRSMDGNERPPSFLSFPKFAGVINEYTENGRMQFSSITNDRKEELIQFILNNSVT